MPFPQIRNQFGNRHTIGDDVRAGVVVGVERVPDGLAAGLLAGVNPVFGLYSYLIGSIVGALSTSSALMAVQATSAMAVIIADVPEIRARGNDGPVLAMLGLLTGVFLLLAAITGLGRLARFVARSVLTGFLNAVACTIIIGQLDALTGYDNHGSNKLAELFDTLTNINRVDWTTALVGLTTIALIVGLERTPLRSLGMVVAVALVSFAVWAFDLSTVETVQGIATVPRALPLPSIPDFSLLAALIIPALSVAFVAAVQGAVITATVANADGTHGDMSGDLRGQGLSSVVCGLFQAVPAAGSMSATQLVVATGARTRTANLLAGAVMVVALLAFAGPIGNIAMAALGALLVVVAVRMIKWAEVQAVVRAGKRQIATMLVTFVLTLVVPVQYAVIVGVALSMLLHVVSLANRITVRRWLIDDEGILEVEPPSVIRAREVVVLAVSGSLFFASAPVLRQKLPSPTSPCAHASLILRLRGQDGIGTTAIHALREYAFELDTAGARLVLVGVGQRLYRQLIDTDFVGAAGVHAVMRERARVGEGVRRAYADAQAWAAAKDSP